ncbi:MAG: 2-amino-4-hydroxy-6-hydroxymethyldihydropteridine diphosphokinase [Armatimonadota bacterium]
MPHAYIAIGSNIHPEDNVHRALLLLARRVRITGISTFYRTAPLGNPGQQAFYNGVVAVETDIPPEALKYQVLRKIEEESGRRRTADKYAPRTIDLDLLLYDDLLLNTETLILPDPDIAARPFLAIPLCELDPARVLPGAGKTLREIAAALPDQEMEPLTAFTAALREDIRHEYYQG